MTTPIHLLLADDHALVREGLKQLFSITDDILVKGEATTGTQVLEILSQKRFDLLLLDMTMPGVSGSDLVARIQAFADAPPILILSMHNEAQIARRALAAGAAGYLTKDSNPDILLAAIRRVAAGGRYLDHALAEDMAFDASAAPKLRPAHDILSGREQEIFLLLAGGLGVNEIANQLAISNKTVSTHKSRLMDKMNFASNAELIRYALERGLI